MAFRGSRRLRHCREMPSRSVAGRQPVDNSPRRHRIGKNLGMHRAPLPEQLTAGSFSLRMSDKAGVSRTRTEAKDLVTVSRGVRVHLGSAAKGGAALRAYTELDDTSALTHVSAARVWRAALGWRLEEDWRIHLSRRPGFSMPRRANVVGHLLTFLPGELVEYDGVRVTSPARTWLDLASMAGVDDLVIAGDSVVCAHGPEFPAPREPLCMVAELQDMVAKHPGVRGIRAARAALELIRVASAAGLRCACPKTTSPVSGPPSCVKSGPRSKAEAGARDDTSRQCQRARLPRSVISVRAVDVSVTRPRDPKHCLCPEMARMVASRKRSTPGSQPTDENSA